MKRRGRCLSSAAAGQVVPWVPEPGASVGGRSGGQSWTWWAGWDLGAAEPLPSKDLESLGFMPVENA